MSEGKTDYRELVAKMHRVAYAMLEDVDRYCRENGILYFLSGGSVLGAVRHKGFIPWDDDIDLMLPRADYEKFLKGFAKAFPGKYMVGSLLTDSEWKRPASRVWDLNTTLIQTKYNERKMGIFLDIFPIDGLPDNPVIRWIHYRRLRVLNIFRNLCIRHDFYETEHYKFFKKILGKIFYGSDARKASERLDRIAKKYDFNKGKYVGAVLAIHYWDKETIPRECMDHEVRLPFEGGMFPVPAGYEQYLKNLYGDYMQIPPDAAEKGYSHLEGWSITINGEEEENHG